MSDDMLSEATRALRDAHEDQHSSSRVTRTRVMASLREKQVRRRTRAVLLIPIAACFVSLSAWGAASGRLPRALQAAAEAIGLQQAPSEPAPPRKAHGPARPATRPTPPAPEAPLAAPPAEPPAREADAPVAPSDAAAAPDRPRAAPSPAPSVPDPTHDLYRTAHRAHFVDQNPALALAAWDEYLRAAPNGRFAVEARYNRALCLARLGRKAEARAALAPFARGDFSGYRQREATELSSALGQD